MPVVHISIVSGKSIFKTFRDGFRNGSLKEGDPVRMALVRYATARLVVLYGALLKLKLQAPGIAAKTLGSPGCSVGPASPRGLWLNGAGPRRAGLSRAGQRHSLA